MSPDLRWRKVRLDATVRARLVRAVDEVNQARGVRLHLISQPFGRIIACELGNLWFVHANDGTKPPRLWTLAVDIGASTPPLVPSHDPSDFAACCDLMGIHGEVDRDAFHRFLFPPASRPAARPVPGAV